MWDSAGTVAPEVHHTWARTVPTHALRPRVGFWSEAAGRKEACAGTKRLLRLEKRTA